VRPQRQCPTVWRRDRPSTILRSRRRVRWLRLAGHAAELHAVDLDDVPPDALVAD